MSARRSPSSRAWYAETNAIPSGSLFEHPHDGDAGCRFLTRARATTDFDEWIAAEFAERGAFTALVILVEIDETKVTPLSSTYFNVIGDEVDWSEISSFHRLRRGLGRRLVLPGHDSLTASARQSCGATAAA